MSFYSFSRDFFLFSFCEEDVDKSEEIAVLGLSYATVCVTGLHTDSVAQDQGRKRYLRAV